MDIHTHADADIRDAHAPRDAHTRDDADTWDADAADDVDTLAVQGFDLLEACDALSRDGDLSGAHALLDQALELCGDRSEGDLPVLTLCGLVRRTQLYDKVHDHTRALETMQEIDRRFRDDTDPEFRWRVAVMLNRAAALLERLGRKDAAIDILRRLVDRYRDDADTPIRKERGAALVALGDLLRELDRSDDALACYREAVAVLTPVLTPELRDQLARALFFLGHLLAGKGEAEAAVKALSVLLSGFRDCYDGLLSPLLAECISLRAKLLKKLGRLSEAVEGLRMAVTLFKNQPSEALGEALCHTLLELGDQLHALGRSDEALEVLHAVSDTPLKGVFGAMTRLKAMAQLKIALIYEFTRRPGEALEAREAFVKRYRDEPDVQPLVIETMACTALQYQVLAQVTAKRGDHRRSAEYLVNAEKYAVGALQRNPDHVSSLCVIAYVAWRRDEPIVDALLARAMLRGGAEASKLLLDLSTEDPKFHARCLRRAAA